ncbi:hypothetical protein ILYODFUR_033984 [Ilyodon furcidens]|uniref:Uncharacterized protein n=1 Tax=Ilyodon furcidens TaxID=33524 RepID=A0ABV0V942_9TELE
MYKTIHSSISSSLPCSCLHRLDWRKYEHERLYHAGRVKDWIWATGPLWGIPVTMLTGLEPCCILYSAKISYIIGLLSNNALKWAEARFQNYLHFGFSFQEFI